MNVIERITERVVVLNYGRKIAEGSYREVAADRQVQEAYLGLEVSGRAFASSASRPPTIARTSSRTSRLRCSPLDHLPAGLQRLARRR